MSVYTRRFTEDPGLDVLLDIESVNVIDLEPPEAFAGLGTGTAILVGEFENGPYNEVTEVFGPTDLVQTFGEFGYTYDGAKGNNPCARGRKADGAIAFEWWNGNGFVHLNGKKFNRLICVRVDTSVGYVQFTRLASVQGLFKPTYNLEPAQVLSLITDLVAGPTAVAFNATAATVVGVGGAFAGIVAGDYLDLAYDGNDTVRVTFQGGDTTIAAVVARINLAFGFTFASDAAGQLRLTGRQRGTGGEVSVVGGSAGLVVAIGHAVADTPGTGNVANIDAVTVSECNTLVVAALPTLNVTRAADGEIVLYNNTTTGVASVTVGPLTTATDFGFPISEIGEQIEAEEDVVIPAGTRVRNAGGTTWVTTENVTCVADEYTGWNAKVRHAYDDGTGALALSATTTILPFQPRGGMFAVTNPLPLSNALTELQLDNAYYAAIQKTLDLNTVAKEANFIWSARQSNICRRAVRENAILASERGCRGRTTCIRPPVGTTRVVARGDAEPGVGAYRHERVFYAYPAVQTYVPAIALVGAAGGEGFAASGVITLGSDGFLTSVCARLPSEENPGQLTTFTDAIIGLEPGTEYTGWVIDDYKQFKRNGICAVRMDEGIAIFQSGVTSLDPATYPAKLRISRRRMADEIQDSLTAISKKHGKKLSRKQRRQQLVIEYAEYLNGLLSKEDASKQRIASWTMDPNRLNTLVSLAAGAYYIYVGVKTYPSLDSIVIQTNVGENVDISEV